MKVSIIRGAGQTGGSIIKVTVNAKESTSILLDCGTLLPEVGQPQTEDDLDMTRIGKVDALFLARQGSHPDLLSKLPPEVELYAPVETLNFMNTLDLYLDRPLRTAVRRVHGLFAGEEVRVGRLSVTAYNVGYSAEGAVGFLVQYLDDRLLYAGNFQCKPDFRPFKPDLLITEGTMQTRGEQAYPDEDAVELALRRVMRETNGRVFVMQSGIDLPRIRSVVDARNRVAPDSREQLYVDLTRSDAFKEPRPLMQDVFLKYVLEQTGHPELAAPYTFVWNGFDKNGDRAYDRIVRHYCDRSAAASCERIDFSYLAVVFIRPTMLAMLEKLIANGMDISRDALVFSMWRGCEKDSQTAKLLELFAQHGVKPQYIHANGHADGQHLKEWIDDLRPKKVACIRNKDAGDVPALCGNAIFVSDGDEIEVLSGQRMNERDKAIMYMRELGMDETVAEHFLGGVVMTTTEHGPAIVTDEAQLAQIRDLDDEDPREGIRVWHVLERDTPNGHITSYLIVFSNERESFWIWYHGQMTALAYSYNASTPGYYSFDEIVIEPYQGGIRQVG